MAQRYTSKTALERMAKGLCPECGRQVMEHTGWGSPQGCTLREDGVKERIEQYRKDREQK